MDKWGRYRVRFWLPSGKDEYLGAYDTAPEAVRVYARRHLEVHGEPPEVQLGTVAEHEATPLTVKRRTMGSSRVD